MRPVIELKFYETYYFANVVKNVLGDQFSYLRSLNDFYGDGNHLTLTAPFRKFSAFHSFLEFVIDELIVEATESVNLSERKSLREKYNSLPSALTDLKPTTLPIEQALEYHGLEFESFNSWLDQQGISFADANDDSVYGYLNELRLSGNYEELLMHSTREAFFLLFGNRELLLLFNSMIARLVQDTAIEEVPEEFSPNFSKSGVLKRVRIPDWVQRAVFYRDRGMCVVCRADLSGVLSIWSEDHFDHMIPLSLGGLNDVTNIQLLCAKCNLKKGGGKILTSQHYEDWYPYPYDFAEK